VGTTITLEDVSIDGVAGTRSDDRLGMGVWAQRGATLEGRRVSIARVHMAGAGVVNGATLTLEDLSIRDVAVAECGTACPDEQGGFGVIAHLFGGRALVTRFEIGSAVLCGVVVGRDPAFPDDPGGELDLANGRVFDTPLGACVQVDGYDLSRLQPGVDYDVEVPLQATSYPLPGEVSAP
jgi:hypothetical protein